MNELRRLWSELMMWRGIFQQFDHNSSGFIEVSELKNIFQSVGQWIPFRVLFLKIFDVLYQPASFVLAADQ